MANHLRCGLSTTQLEDDQLSLTSPPGDADTPPACASEIQNPCKKKHRSKSSCGSTNNTCDINLFSPSEMRLNINNMMSNHIPFGAVPFFGSLFGGNGGMPPLGPFLPNFWSTPLSGALFSPFGILPNPFLAGLNPFQPTASAMEKSDNSNSPSTSSLQPTLSPNFTMVSLLFQGCICIPDKQTPGNEGGEKPSPTAA